TPQLALATWHGAPFERERLRLVGELWNGIKRREKRFSRGDHPGGRRPPGATSTAVHRKETLMLLPSHTHRREIADGDRPTGRATRTTPGSPTSLTNCAGRRSCRFPPSRRRSE